MPLDIGGVPHKTINEAASELSVHPNTLRSYIDKGIVTEPPALPNGLVDRRYFPDDWFVKAKAGISAYRNQRKRTS